MKKLGEFGAALHDAMFEHDAAHEQPQEPTYPTAVPTAALPETHYAKTYTGSSAPADSVTDAAYQHLCAITAPDGERFIIIGNFQSMMDKLVRSVPEKSMRMKAALDLGGATVERLLADLQAMRGALDADIRSTQQQLKESVVTAATEVERLEKNLAVARSNYNKANNAQAAITIAATHRSTDLDQMEKEFKELQ